jgi:signal transduction histidine kinase
MRTELDVVLGRPSATNDELRAMGEVCSQRGVGLGLSIVRAVATAHRGTANIEPVDGGGVRVLVAIPSAPDQTR